jgi:hypothetical protein
LDGARDDDANETEDRAFADGEDRAGGVRERAMVNELAQRHQARPLPVYGSPKAREALASSCWTRGMLGTTNAMVER